MLTNSAQTQKLVHKAEQSRTVVGKFLSSTSNTFHPKDEILMKRLEPF